MPKLTSLFSTTLVGSRGHGETGPPASAVVLLGRGEEGFSRDDVDVDARILLVPELIVERGLSAPLLGDLVLPRGQPIYRCRVLFILCAHGVSLIMISVFQLTSVVTRADRCARGGAL
jgi:hypothetical protein